MSASNSKRNRDDCVPEEKSGSQQVWVPSTIHEACFYNHLEKLGEFMDETKPDETEGKKRLLALMTSSATVIGQKASKTPLIWAFASREGKASAFSLLDSVLVKYPDLYTTVVNTVDDDGDTLAQYAVDLEDFEQLVRIGADLNAGGKGTSMKEPPLTRACNALFSSFYHSDGALPQVWPPKLFDFLIHQGRCQVNLPNRWGAPLLHTICARPDCGGQHIVDLLLKNGADPSIQDDQGRTALHYLMLSDSRNNH